MPEMAPGTNSPPSYWVRWIAPISRYHLKYMPRMKYGAFWANDDIKLTHNLNITLGLRVDIQGGLTEEFGRFSTFDPSAQNLVGVSGATIFHNSKANGN